MRTDNAFIEELNGRFRQECLNENWSPSLEDAMDKVDTWRNHYNVKRSHNALGSPSPREFAALKETAVRPSEPALRLVQEMGQGQQLVVQM